MAQIPRTLGCVRCTPALAIGSQAAYLWHAAGLIDSNLSHVFARRAGEPVTTRNWATVLKLQAASNGLA